PCWTRWSITASNNSANSPASPYPSLARPVAKMCRYQWSPDRATGLDRRSPLRVRAGDLRSGGVARAGDRATTRCRWPSGRRRQRTAAASVGFPDHPRKIRACAGSTLTEPVMSQAPQFTNRLVHETSPYLRQHAHNPVEWFPWGDEALAAARRLDRPIFLSIGYSACHWCHVMEHESFEDPEVGKLLNDHFVSIKVDREERPDLDQI